jgi:hypothetical protein
VADTVKNKIAIKLSFFMVKKLISNVCLFLK